MTETEQTYLQELKDQAPVGYGVPKYTEQQAHTIAKEFWNEFKPKLGEVLEALFKIRSATPSDDAYKLRAEYHAIYEIRRSCSKFVHYSRTLSTTHDVEYGYQDFSGQWHHAYTKQESDLSTDKSGGRVSCDVYDYAFYERRTDSPVLHRWIVPGPQNTFDCSKHTSLSSTPYVHLFSGVIARPEKADWEKLDKKSAAHLSNEVRYELQKNELRGKVGFADEEIATTGQKQIIMWPFYFADFEVNGHVFTVRIDAMKGFVNLFVDNPQGLELDADSVKSEQKKSEKVGGINTSDLGKYSLICGILSMFLPVILSIISIILGVKALKTTDIGRGKAIAGIVISIVVILLTIFYFVGLQALMTEEAEAVIKLLCI